MQGDESNDRPDWTLFHSNAEIWPAVIAECETARRSLTLEQYIFSRRGIGARLLDVLTAAAKRGVEVRLLADGFGSFGLPWSDPARRLVAAGGRLELYDSLSDIARSPAGRLHRLHRKVVVRDGGEAAVIGGACYADRMSDWRDTMIRIEGGTVPRVAAGVFDQLWAHAVDRGPKRAPAHTPPEVMPEDWAYMLTTPARPAERELWNTLRGQIETAEHSVTLTTPYLVPDEAFREAIGGAAARGVTVRIVLPARSDQPPLDIVGRRFARGLKRQGVRIHLYEPSMIHAKLALIDNRWGSVSSFNLDILSFWMNLESGVVGTDPGFCSALGEQLDRDLHGSVRL